MKKRNIFVLVIVAVAALMGYRFWKLHTVQPAMSIDAIQKEQGIGVDVFTVQGQRLERTVTLAGSVAAFCRCGHYAHDYRTDRGTARADR